ncbi:hypothetical protein COCOBI_03-6070 [Coccomyxa sp. Obi]|nr:hypothetical protein COCOBI_03-6070 [Coccomyxa sp. Obi]
MSDLVTNLSSKLPDLTTKVCSDASICSCFTGCVVKPDTYRLGSSILPPSREFQMKRGWADKWAAGNAKESQSETSSTPSTATGPPRITLPLKDAVDPSNPRARDLKGTVTVEFRKNSYATGHCYVSSHTAACEGIPEDQILAEDILFQVENDGLPMFGLLSQNFPDAANGPRVGTNEIVFNPAKAFQCNLQLLIDKGFVRDTGRRVDQGFYRDLPVVSVLF